MPPLYFHCRKFLTEILPNKHALKKFRGILPTGHLLYSIIVRNESTSIRGNNVPFVFLLMSLLFFFVLLDWRISLQSMTAPFIVLADCQCMGQLIAIDLIINVEVVVKKTDLIRNMLWIPSVVQDCKIYLYCFIDGQMINAKAYSVLVPLCFTIKGFNCHLTWPNLVIL